MEVSDIVRKHLHYAFPPVYHVSTLLFEVASKGTAAGAEVDVSNIIGNVPIVADVLHRRKVQHSDGI